MYGVIVVHAGRSRSTYHGHDAYIHDHCLDIVITLCFSINCSTVICSPTILFAILREATSETYGPRVSSLLYYISFPLSHLAYVLVIFYIYLYQISSLQMTVKGLTTP